MFPLLLQICFISPYNQIIKRNNHIIKTNNQIFKTTNMWIRPRLADVGNMYPAINTEVAENFSDCTFTMHAEFIFKTGLSLQRTTSLIRNSQTLE